ncbi:hypothetical protein OS493_029417 [Desmophyllum pertusum]|uniref:Transmembrane protein n=1 Tax=Desmophyllum pertusum TaxID=174260 RepID=A0A9X0CQU1_9CNID|nr:hypothetical protein OS493_029417 [Desmophyllum pertusum]
MALQLLHVGRFVVFALLLTQCGFFAAYPAWYKDDLRWIGVVALYLPALLYWLYCLKTGAELLRMFFNWGLYVVVALVPNIAITFATCGDDLDKKNFLGPNTLKVVLCITPILFLFLLNTADDLNKSDHEAYRDLAKKLSIQITIDLFDGVEMLDVVLDDRELGNSYGIPKEFGIVMIAVACLSFVLSLLQMAETELLDNGSTRLRKRLAIIWNALQLSLVNFAFLIIRLVIFFGYHKDESIFIAKNGIAIFLSALEIYWIKTN